MEFQSYIETIASTATAIGVLLVFWQVWLSRKQAITAFEDQITNEYRHIVQNIPVDALLAKEFDDSQIKNCLNELYNYIDFTNEQIFLRQQKRIRKVTWDNWSEGIESNFKLPAFTKAWGIIKESVPGSFNELRKLEKEQFKSDPATWG